MQATFKIPKILRYWKRKILEKMNLKMFHKYL